MLSLFILSVENPTLAIKRASIPESRVQVTHDLSFYSWKKLFSVVFQLTVITPLSSRSFIANSLFYLLGSNDILTK